MGSLNGAHMVSALFVFGPSVLLVRLHAVAWSLLFPLGLYVLTRRLYDETSARLTLLLAAVPPFLLTYFSTVAEPHFEAISSGVLLLLLALVVLEAPAGAQRTRVAACLGLVAGLACWTNVKTMVVLGPIGFVWLLRDPRWPLRRDGGLFAAGFLGDGAGVQRPLRARRAPRGALAIPRRGRDQRALRPRASVGSSGRLVGRTRPTRACPGPGRYAAGARRRWSQ
jgi:hypothetical protein